MSIWLGILLICLGLGFVFLEFILPSGGLLTVLAVVSFIGGLVIAGNAGVAHFAIFLVAIVVLVPVVLVLAVNIFPYTPFGKAMILSPGKRKDDPDSGKKTASDGKQVSVPDYSEYMGKKGVAETQLRPSGIADISGERLNVVSEGEMIEKGASVKVIDVKGYRIVVAPVEEGV